MYICILIRFFNDTKRRDEQVVGLTVRVTPSHCSSVTQRALHRKDVRSSGAAPITLRHKLPVTSPAPTHSQFHGI